MYRRFSMPNSREIIRKQLSQIHKQLGQLRDKQEVIQAKYTKNIWLDEQYIKLDYNQRNKLRQAELTLKLSEDAEYQTIHSRIRDLEAEQVELDYFEFDDIGLDDTI
jgi:hypothetical protein